MHTRKIGGEFCEYEVWVTDSMMIRFGKYIEKDKNFYIHSEDDHDSYLNLDIDKPFSSKNRAINYIKAMAKEHAIEILSNIEACEKEQS